MIGVHTLELFFEHILDSFQRTAKNWRVVYPIAIDNNCVIRTTKTLADLQFEIEFLDAGLEAFLFSYG